MSTRWTVEFCKKKEKNLTSLEKILTHYGDAWVWLAFDPVSKILPAFVVGKKTKANEYRLVEKIYKWHEFTGILKLDIWVWFFGIERTDWYANVFDVW